MIRWVRAVLEGWGTTATWCLILAMPRKRRHSLIDKAIRETPAFVYMSSLGQDKVIAWFFWHPRYRYYR